MLKTVVLSSVASALTTLATLLVFQSSQVSANQSRQQFDHIRVRGIEVVDLTDKPVIQIGSDVMNGTSGIWIGGPPPESRRIELLYSALPGPTGVNEVGILIRDDTRAVRNDPAVRGGHAGGPILWQAP